MANQVAVEAARANSIGFRALVRHKKGSAITVAANAASIKSCSGRCVQSLSRRESDWYPVGE